MAHDRPDSTATNTKHYSSDGSGRIPIKAIYGNVTMMKYWCEFCQSYALVVGGKLQCCDRTIQQEATACKLKREADAVYARRGPNEKTKRKILAFQNHQCVYCGRRLTGKTPIEWDHFFCFSYSANNQDRNFVASCKLCNRFKAAMVFTTMLEAQIYVRNKRTERGLENLDYFGGSYESQKGGENV